MSEREGGKQGQICCDGRRHFHSLMSPPTLVQALLYPGRKMYMEGIGSKVCLFRSHTALDYTQEQVTDLTKTLVPWLFWSIHQWDPQV